MNSPVCPPSGWNGIPFFNHCLLQVSQHGGVGHSDSNIMPQLIPQGFNVVVRNPQSGILCWGETNIVSEDRVLSQSVEI